MGASPKARARYFSGSGKGLSKGTRETDSRRSPRTVLASPANTPSPSPSIGPDTEAASKVTQSTAATGSEDIAPEIVVWTGHMNNMMGDSSESATSTTPATPASEEKTVYVPRFYLLISLSLSHTHTYIHTSSAVLYETGRVPLFHICTDTYLPSPLSGSFVLHVP